MELRTNKGRAGANKWMKIETFVKQLLSDHEWKIFLANISRTTFFRCDISKEWVESLWTFV